MAGEDRHFFPLTSLQIGDMQSYKSRLAIFLAPKSKRFFILLDNPPWLLDHDTKAPAALWQLMVTKSRSSPFTNKKAKKRSSSYGRKLNFVGSPISTPISTKNSSGWYKVYDEVVRQNKTLQQVRKLKDPHLMTKELHRIMYGYIVFEVDWAHVRGINYVNELQHDTSMALEARAMKRWEFDSIEQALSSMYSWFSGDSYERHLLQVFLEGLSSPKGDVFYDAQGCKSTSEKGCENVEYCHMSCSGIFGSSIYEKSAGSSSSTDPEPPSTGPYKRRKISRSNSDSVNSEESYAETSTSRASPEFSDGDYERASLTFETSNYRDVLILFRFSDLELPSKLKEIILHDLRLLTLLEYGLPPWVIFLQSYPLFCKIYRPWMCPLARTLYVIMSFITVLIGFYDLYKNVPLLKATAAKLLGPLFHWIETWEMVSRIKYLGTMLVLHNFEQAVRWSLNIINATKTTLGILTKPFVGPILEGLELLLPVWNIFADTCGYLSCGIWTTMESLYSFIMSIFKIIVWPFWFVLQTLISIASCLLYPFIWIISEILATPIRLSIAISSFIVGSLRKCYDLMKQLLSLVAAVFQYASTVRSSETSNEYKIWSSLLKDLLYQVFRAVRSILYGIVAFFSTCNRHRLSISNHLHKFFRRFSEITGQHTCCVEETLNQIDQSDIDGHLRRKGITAEKDIKVT